MIHVNWNQIVEERNEWVAHNFPNARTPLDSVMGVVEELGELVHCELKMAQNIRGITESDSQDAVGDTIVYLLGILNWLDYRPDENFSPFGRQPAPNADEALARACVPAAHIYLNIVQGLAIAR